MTLYMHNNSAQARRQTQTRPYYVEVHIVNDNAQVNINIMVIPTQLSMQVRLYLRIYIEFVKHTYTA